ncbi:pentapeptide repeat-containing protein [Luteimonas sp. e5]
MSARTRRHSLWRLGSRCPVHAEGTSTRHRSIRAVEAHRWLAPALLRSGCAVDGRRSNRLCISVLYSARNRLVLAAVQPGVFVGCTFAGCTFRGAVFAGCRFVDCRFEDCTFGPDNLGGECEFNETVWYGCTQINCSGLGALVPTEV